MKANRLYSPSRNYAWVVNQGRNDFYEALTKLRKDGDAG